MDNLNMSIGSVLRDKRIALNIKQDDIAEQLGVTVQTVSKWERDVTEPKASQVAQLSKILHLPEKSICEGKLASGSDNPMDFMMKFGKVLHNVNSTALMITLYDHINDEDAFLEDLIKQTDLPREAFGLK
ncbi:helix-turn-helix transcriptional regulator [Shewanella sp. GD03713]|jgi:transcriptional regulator with XRE-family HTH domain|uniref:helix-turn-helix domain-containing protein n=1 Tax=Shewanella sp. GD03713 TaxID=2975372 RepID=UPI000B34886E|nr:helix-turn-helix transcriptional regulator [Shewanella sp. GD03713]QXN23211.1 helix-turn-helix domain-containing protein [Shewanella putrefaciens]MDH1470433.1 helix-turn-helix domain-containing protein [Shewanella sp. GD03713]MDH1470439.1 helix-turn-helix domain-containing protein [Shewanella sp. GD03713]VEE64359.1 transcriptional repressor DicA [Shewanella putrefaciens]VEE64365.1 transcriptional repressor DicA [Shewanella putrefaciens]